MFFSLSTPLCFFLLTLNIAPNPKGKFAKIAKVAIYLIGWSLFFSSQNLRSVPPLKKMVFITYSFYRSIPYILQNIHEAPNQIFNRLFSRPQWFAMKEGTLSFFFLRIKSITLKSKILKFYEKKILERLLFISYPPQILNAKNLYLSKLTKEGQTQCYKGSENLF